MDKQQADVETFLQKIGAIEIDPRKRFHAAFENIVDRELYGIDKDIVEEILSSRLPAIVEQATEAILSGDWSRSARVLSDVALDLQRVAQLARAKAKPVTPESETRRMARELRRYGWTGLELDCSALQTGERILEVGRDEIRTNTRTIDRRTLLAFELSVRRVFERELSGFPNEIVEDLQATRLPRLAALANEVRQRGAYKELGEILAKLSADLQTVAKHERTHGRLVRRSPSEEVERVADHFFRYKWNGFEVSCLTQTLHGGERILEVAFREIRTSERTIGRGFDELRTHGWSIEGWRRQGTPEHVIKEAEAADLRAADRASRPFSDSSGPDVRQR
jgi:hypothetical protein